MYAAMCDTIPSRSRRRRKPRAEWIDRLADAPPHCATPVDAHRHRTLERRAYALETRSRTLDRARDGVIDADL